MEKENVLYILENTRKAIEEKNIFVMKEMSNRTVHSASVYQDPESIAVAVIVYALSKIYERSKYLQYKEWLFFEKNIKENLEKAIADLRQDRREEFKNDLQEIRNSIKMLSGHFRFYVEDVFRKAMINKASRIYEHGISMHQTAELLGISVFELNEYVGKTGIADVNLGITMDIKKRIEKAMKLFE